MFSVIILAVASTLGFAEDYSITVNSLGIGNKWSGGMVTPLHVSVTSNLSEATSAWVQWEVPDANGDSILWGKQITLSPNGTASTWLYAPVQPWAKPSFAWNVALREWDGDEPTAILAKTRFSPNSIGAIQLDPTQGFIACFGTRKMGLTGYQPHQQPDVKQEATIITSGLRSSDLPDAWPCFESLDAIVWADATPVFTYRQEIAIQQWIQRGGHFIISLPTIGDPWNLSADNGPLSELLAGVETSVEQVPIGYLDQVLGRNRGWPSIDVTIRTFSHQNNSKNGNYLFPIVTLRNQKVIGVQKSIGFGSLTIIGVDLTNGQLTSLGLPETDVFWNRILGKRSDAPSPNTISLLAQDEQLSKAIPTENMLSAGNLIAQEIAMSTTASGRLGTVFLLILSYWLVSGPIGYFILKIRKKQRWSWVVFSCIATFFALLTLVLSSTTSTVKTPLKHVTIIDQVYGVNEQRAIGWCSLFLPSFGVMDISLEGSENNLLLPWSSPESSSTPPFVDRREIIVNLDHVPNQLNQPSRATTSNFSYEWLGGINHTFYDSLIDIDSNNKPELNATSGEIRGTIVNQTTKPLHDVTVIWVTDVRNTIPSLGQFQDNSIAPWIAPSKSGQPLNLAYTWRLATWKPEEFFNLATLGFDPQSTLNTAVKNRYQTKDPNSYYAGTTVVPNKLWRTKMEMLSLYSHLEPPVYQKKAASKQNPKSHKTIRKGGHVLDFAEWFSKPCIIVMGFIDNAPLPVPIFVDGEKNTNSTGKTFVRWVYPFEKSQ